MGTASSSSMESLDDSANANSNEDEDNDDENQKSLTIFVGEEKVNFPVKPDSVITFESVRENLLSDPIWNFSEDKLSKIRKEKYQYIRVGDNKEVLNYIDEEIHLSSKQNLHEEDVDTRRVIFFLFLKGLIGWSPHIWNNRKKLKYDRNSSNWKNIKNCMTAMFFLTVFFFDFLDAVVDLILGFRTALYGSTGNKRYGILTVSMTIIGRILAGLFTVVYNTKQNRLLTSKERRLIPEIFQTYSYIKEEIDMLSFYFFVETAIFMMEDGSAIILLASNPKDDVLTTISTWLSVICACCFLLYLNLTIFWRVLLENFYWFLGLVRKDKFSQLATNLLFTCCQAIPIFMVYILFKEVILSDKNRDDDGLSGNLKLVTWVLYGFGSVFFGIITFGLSLYLLNTTPPTQQNDENEYQPPTPYQP